MIPSHRSLDLKRPSGDHPTTLLTSTTRNHPSNPNLLSSSSASSITGQLDIDRIEYVDPQKLLRARHLRSSSNSAGNALRSSSDPKPDPVDGSSQDSILDLQPIKRIHVVEDLDRLVRSKGLNRLILILINISNRISRFGVLQFDDQIDHLQKSLNPRIQSIIEILDELERWITEIPLDKAPQRFGNRAFKIWGQRLESEAKRLHERVIDPDHKPIEAELLHHFKTSFGSFVRLDYGTGHELSFLAYLSILHLTRILKNEDLLMSGLFIFQRYFNLCKSLQRIFNLEPAGSKGVYGLDDFFHIVYILGSAQLLYHPTIEPGSILDESFVLRINRIDDDRDERGNGSVEGTDPELSSESKQFMRRHGLVPSLFFESIRNTIDLKSKMVRSMMTKAQTCQSTRMTEQRVSTEDRDQELKMGKEVNLPPIPPPTTSSKGFLDHSPILWNLGTNVKTWSKIHNGLIKMFKGEILNKLPVMQHFWMTDSTGVLSWVDLNEPIRPSTPPPPPPPPSLELDRVRPEGDRDEEEEDRDYGSDYAHVLRKPIQSIPNMIPPTDPIRS